jgi:hypothetical protein
LKAPMAQQSKNSGLLQTIPNYYKYTNKANAIIASHFMLRRA